MTRKKEITIYDLAQELNLSASTISRALQNHYSIGSKTKETVKKLAEQRGYHANTIAASLRKSKTNTIGVIIPLINRPFISSLISGIEVAAKEAGYNVIISQSHDDFETEVTSAEALFGSRVSGLVVSLGMETQSYDHLRRFTRQHIPVVFVDRVTKDLGTDLIVIDNHQAGYEATKHLIDQGCKRIAHIAGAQHRNIYKERLDGYRDALTSHGIGIDEEIILQSKFLSHEEGLDFAEKLMNMKDRPDGVFCANDTTAISVILYAKKIGVKIPDELAVIGFNNDPQSEIVDPPLSTMVHPAVDMGRLAAQQVIRQKDHSEIERSETIVLKTKLLIRGSSLRNLDK